MPFLLQGAIYYATPNQARCRFSLVERESEIFAYLHSDAINGTGTHVLDLGVPAMEARVDLPTGMY
jgi:hypothetical protein